MSEAKAPSSRPFASGAFTQASIAGAALPVPKITVFSVAIS